MEMSDIIAILSLLGTIGIGIYTANLTNRINKISLNANFFNKLFLDILLEKLPEALDEAISTNLKETDSLEDIMIDLNKKIVAYKYMDKDFYEKVYNQVVNIDEFLVLDKNKNIKNTSAQNTKLEEKVEKLYQIFMTKYTK
ncbi:MAG: hypothetical protein ACRCZ9_00750 [Fusobacteriaceae bacterium]